MIECEEYQINFFLIMITCSSVDKIFTDYNW